MIKIGPAALEACSSNLECWESSQHLSNDRGKPGNTSEMLSTLHNYER